MALQPFPMYAAGFNARGKSPGMNTIHREVLDIHQNELVETIDTRTVLRELLAQGMLGDFHCQQLEHVYPEGRIVANRLLLAFVRKQGSAGYYALLRALAVCDGTGIVTRMIQTEKEVCKVLGAGYSSKQWCCSEAAAPITRNTEGPLCRASSSTPCYSCLAELETKVNMLMHLVRSPMNIPGCQTDPDQQLTALEKEVDELEMTLEKLRQTTTDGGQDTDAIKSKSVASATEEPAKQKAGVARIHFVPDLDQRLSRVERLLGLGPGVLDLAGQQSHSSDREQRLDKLEEKVTRMKEVAKSLLQNSPSCKDNELSKSDKASEEKDLRPAQYGL